MRFVTLSLKAVGPFTDGGLDLSGGAHGLHVIYGPNEAGKSSTLRALRYLLFGFPSARTKEGRTLGDTFLHSQQNLRVGATLANGSGETLTVMRRMAASQSLRGADDAEVVDEAELRKFLGNVDAPRFETFFGIDHQRLVDGGRAILAGHGDVGQILFVASGLESLQKVQSSLGTEVDALFNESTRASRPQINSLLQSLKKAEQEIKTLSLPAKEWDDHNEALQSALKRKAEVERILSEKTRNQARSERRRAALQLLPECDRWRGELETVRDAVLLPEGFSEKRQKLQERVASETGKLKRSEENLEPLRRQIAGVEVPESLVSQQEIIEPLLERRGVYRQAMSDRPELERKLREDEIRARDGLQAIERQLTVDQAGQVQISEAQRGRVRKLVTSWQKIVQQHDAARDAAGRLEQRLVEARERLAALPAETDASPLQAAVQSITRLGDLDRQASDARLECDNTRTQLESDIRRLSFWTGSLEALRGLPVPPVETVERFDSDLSAAAQHRTQTATRRDEATRERDELARALQAMREGQDIPMDDDLKTARTRRDAAWVELRRRLQNERHASSESTGDLVASFEDQKRFADDLADRLRREADKVAQYAERASHLRKLETDAERRSREAEAATARHDELTAQWTALWASTGIAPRTPREMLTFLRRHADLVQKAEAQSERESRAAAIERRREEQIKLLSQRIQEATPGGRTVSGSLGELLARAEAILQSVRGASQERSEAARDVQQAERELSGAQGARPRLERAQAELSEWRQQWEAVIADLPLAPHSTPDEASADLDRLSDAKQALKLADETRHRLQQIDDSCRRFEADVRGLTGRLAPDLATFPVDQAAAELHGRLAKALRDKASHDLLSKKLAEEERAAETARAKVAELQVQVDQLIRDAGCETAADLPAAEQRSTARRRAAEKVDELESRLRDQAGGMPLEEFLAEIRAIDRETLAADAARLDAEIDGLNRELRDVLGEQIGAEKKTLAAMDSSGRAAEAAENARDIVLRLSGEAERFTRLRLAQAVLKAGIDRYRERHQGPILGRASTIFARLTCGAFSGLRQDFDDEGRPVLMGLRAANGAAVPIEGMSDGTADQIYLAVRLAWLDEFLQHHAPVPFIVDDILMRFDDERSVETLKALGDLSARTQVLFFTHHRHLADLAKRTLPKVVHVHELPRSFIASSS
jgi:uncharacterized protein YhaN